MRLEDDMDVGGTKSFIKLKDKESVEGVFRGDRYKFQQHWLNNKSFPCLGSGCEKCKEGVRVAQRFRLNFVTKENGVYVAKIFEQGPVVYKTLIDLNKEYPLEHYVVKITRSGLGTDTSYTILPRKNGALTADQEAVISKVSLNNLTHDPASSGDLDPASGGSPFMEEDIPF